MYLVELKKGLWISNHYESYYEPSFTKDRNRARIYEALEIARHALLVAQSYGSFMLGEPFEGAQVVEVV
jgi:hypothetical protein